LCCSNRGSEFRIPNNRLSDNLLHLFRIHFPHIDNPLRERKQTFELFWEHVAIEVELRMAFERCFDRFGEFCGVRCGEDDLRDVGGASKC
jgi:hypothetical protein